MFKKDYSKIGLVVYAYNPSTQEAENYAGTQLPCETFPSLPPSPTHQRAKNKETKMITLVAY